MTLIPTIPGILISSSVVPIALSILWARATAAGVIGEFFRTHQNYCFSSLLALEQKTFFEQPIRSHNSISPLKRIFKVDLNLLQKRPFCDLRKTFDKVPEQQTMTILISTLMEKRESE